MVSGLKINGQPTYCPTEFEELNGRIFQRIYSHWDLLKPVLERDHFKLFCILTDKPFDRMEHTPENEVAMEELTRWVLETEPQFKIVESITIQGRTISIPRDIGALPVGQSLLLKAAIDRTKFLQENICFACAVYLQPLLDGSKPNLESIKKWESEFEKLPITDIFSVGFFLLSHATRSSQRSPSVWRQIKKLRGMLQAKALHTWRKHTGYKGLIINHS